MRLCESFCVCMYVCAPVSLYACVYVCACMSVFIFNAHVCLCVSSCHIVFSQLQQILF